MYPKTTKIKVAALRWSIILLTYLCGTGCSDDHGKSDESSGPLRNKSSLSSNEYAPRTAQELKESIDTTNLEKDSNLSPQQIARNRVEGYYNQSINSNDVQLATSVISEIDRIASSSLTDEEKRRLIEKQRTQFDFHWWSKGKHEKALLLLQISHQVKTRDAWIQCIIEGTTRGDEKCIYPMKEILEKRTDLDQIQRTLLYEGIADLGGVSELDYLREEYMNARSDRERSVLALNLAKLGDKSGASTLIADYEERAGKPMVQKHILKILRDLYKTDYGNDIKAWKEHVLKGAE